MLVMNTGVYFHLVSGKLVLVKSGQMALPLSTKYSLKLVLCIGEYTLKFDTLVLGSVFLSLKRAFLN